ncbi:MAG: hypothetical protein EHM87_23775 [Burkholderiales bacterium]|nr:MAG: hypothetical protein EHM87_23775 [Burkholderiales bacterium]
MKKKIKLSETENDNMLAEYDFTEKKGVRGKYYRAYRQGHTVKIYQNGETVSVQYFTSEDGSVMLDPDVRKYFQDSEAVNTALRSLIAIIQHNPEYNNIIKKSLTLE